MLKDEELELMFVYKFIFELDNKKASVLYKTYTPFTKEFIERPDYWDTWLEVNLSKKNIKTKKIVCVNKPNKNVLNHLKKQGYEV